MSSFSQSHNLLYFVLSEQRGVRASIVYTCPVSAYIYRLYNAMVAFYGPAASHRA